MTTLVTGAFGCIGACAQPTSLADGVRKTLDEFARPQKDGRLDCRELA